MFSTKDDLAIRRRRFLYAIVLIATFILMPFVTAVTNTYAATTNYTLSKRLRVIEVRYEPAGNTGTAYNPDYLSSQLRTMLKAGTNYRVTNQGGIDVDVIEVINKTEYRPNIDGNFVTTYNKILADNNLCTKIKSQNIDQIWLWVDPVRDPGPGMEYSFSSPYFRNGINYTDGLPSTQYCNGESTFAIMGFDTTRPAENALHSMGHFMESLIGNIEGTDLFWNRFAGNNSNGTMAARCGNVHFPPNTNSTQSYGYNVTTAVTNNMCEKWAPTLPTNGGKTVTCTTWGCTQAGYLQWWMKSFPGTNNTLTFNNKKLPNWWDFLTDFNNALYNYKLNGYWIDPTFLTNNTVPTAYKAKVTVPAGITVTGTNSGCNCVGSDNSLNPITSNKCGYSIRGGDNKCYKCATGGFVADPTNTTCGCEPKNPYNSNYRNCDGTPYVPPAPVCSCTGTDLSGHSVTINTCGGTVTGADALCYQCNTTGWSTVANSMCQTTPVSAPAAPSCLCMGTNNLGQQVTINTCGGTTLGADNACYQCNTTGWSSVAGSLCAAPPAAPVCSCSGTNSAGQPVTINTCGGTVKGQDLACYQCNSAGWSVVNGSLCP